MENKDDIKLYWEVLLDGYKRPTHNIVPVYLTDREYDILSHGRHFIYDSYDEALASVAV